MKNKLVDELNQFLADLNLLYRKLQNYHWNISGKDFFVLHAKLEEYYDGVNEEIDQVAEQILMLQGQPYGTMKDYLAMGKIEEASNEPVSSAHVFEKVLADFGYCREQLTAIKKEADKEEEFEVSAMADSMLADYTKSIWMIRQSMAK